MEVLPGRKLLICDQTQQQIVLLEIDYHNNLHLRTLSSVMLPSVPHSITLINTTSALVSLPNENSIHKIEITNDNLVLTSTITTDEDSTHEYIRVFKYKHNLLAIEKTGEGTIITEISQDGKELKRITPTTVSTIQPIGFVTMSQGHSTIYITENNMAVWEFH